MADLIDRQALVERHCEGCTAAVREECKNDPICGSMMWVVEEPAVDAVPRGVLEQIRWERDIAIEQLNSYGVSLGEKADCVKVVRCKDCKWCVEQDELTRSGHCDCIHRDVFVESHDGFEAVSFDDFCSYGERREE